MALGPGLPRWASTRKVKPIWILLKQETVSGISWAICKSAPCSRKITTLTPHHSTFTGRMPFLASNQQCQCTEEWRCFPAIYRKHTKQSQTLKVWLKVCFQLFSFPVFINYNFVHDWPTTELPLFHKLKLQFICINYHQVSYQNRQTTCLIAQYLFRLDWKILMQHISCLLTDAKWNAWTARTRALPRMQFKCWNFTVLTDTVSTVTLWVNDFA